MEGERFQVFQQTATRAVRDGLGLARGTRRVQYPNRMIEGHGLEFQAGMRAVQHVVPRDGTFQPGVDVEAGYQNRQPNAR